MRGTGILNCLDIIIMFILFYIWRCIAFYNYVFHYVVGNKFLLIPQPLDIQPVDFPQLTWGGHFTGKLCRKLDTTYQYPTEPFI